MSEEKVRWLQHNGQVAAKLFTPEIPKGFSRLKHFTPDPPAIGIAVSMSYII